MEIGANLSRELSQRQVVCTLPGVDDSWITTAEAAAILNRTPRLVRHLAQTGQVEWFKPGRDLFVKREDIERLAKVERKRGRRKATRS